MIWSKPFFDGGKMLEETTKYYNVEWEIEFIPTCIHFCQNLVVWLHHDKHRLGARVIMMRDKSHILHPQEALDSEQYYLLFITELCLRSLWFFISGGWQKCTLISFCLLDNLVFHFWGIYSLLVLEPEGRGKSKHMEHDLSQGFCLIITPRFTMPQLALTVSALNINKAI